MKKINYIVLGNTGFIGKNLENYLLRKKKVVKGFASKKINLLIKAKALKLSKFINSKTIIFFLSFNKNQKNATGEDLQKNLLLTKNFLEALNKNKPKSVLFFSSQSIYGENTNNSNTTEKTLPDPTSFYGIAKYTAERMVTKYCSEKKIPLIIVRIPRVYGLGDDVNNYGPMKFTDFFKKKKTLTLWGDGSEKRDYLYIDDLNEILLKLIKKNFTGLVNICSGTAHSFLQIIKHIESLTKQRYKLKKKRRSRPKVDHIMNNKFLKQIIGDYKFTSLKSGLSLLIKN
mgnify:FL=1